MLRNIAILRKFKNKGRVLRTGWILFFWKSLLRCSWCYFDKL